MHGAAGLKSDRKEGGDHGAVGLHAGREEHGDRGAVGLQADRVPVGLDSNLFGGLLAVRLDSNLCREENNLGSNQ